MKTMIALVALLSAMGCASPNGSGAVDEVPGDFVIAISQTPCFGTCPVYTVRVSADGELVYYGERFVEAEGDRTGEIEPAEVERIWGLAQAAKIFELEEHYGVGNPACGPPIADMPGTTVAIRADERVHSVFRDDGCEYRPEGWRALVSAVTELPEVQAWIGDR